MEFFMKSKALFLNTWVWQYLSFTTTYSYDKENWDLDLLLSYKIRLDLDQSLVSFLNAYATQR